ncbi:GGDEF domain-containing phosphodiesterase [Marinobacter sp. SS13-12]|uniref:putative bifunctional diguanylate cyclase/phosphodiesterase n=1 Tax=Marinobacter sp. SS13-12 TaxID=3050451 RepID=UPI0025573DD7|nr:GGDEF domain-containing phosphodiesterase [Marinobacter sp. SS13-12]MDK8462310.1 EAL domain-containing protein [Marinobacter sp. SS13-12]
MKSPAGIHTDLEGDEQLAGSPRDYWQSVSQWGRQLMSCRLCRNLTMAAFVAILLIEFVILIPSYRNYEEDLLSQHAAVARQAMTTYLATKPDDVTAESLQKLLDSSRVTGLELMVNDRWLRVGEPVTDVGDASGRLRDLPRPANQRLDLVWNSGQWLGDYPVRARVDITGVSGELTAFVVRILGLSLLIAVFVTMVTMAVVDRMMLSPLLRLRSRIVQAGGDAEHPLTYVREPERCDEFGEVEGAFNSMLEQNASYLNRLQSLNKRLDQLLMERTRSLKQTEQELRLRSLYDQLTGLANRNLFEERLTRFLAEAGSREAMPSALVVLGLNDFQALNGLAGHETGDRVLQEIARRLAGFSREPGYVARLGGDVFGLLLTPHQGLKEDLLETDIAAVINACIAPVQVAGKQYQCDVSAGVALAPLDGNEAGALLSHAEIAMHRAKKSSDSQVQFFSSDLGEQIQRRQDMVKDLRSAIEKQQLELHYQPQFDRLRRCVGYEALLRWRHPEFGMVSPDEFVPVAEEAGLIGPIGLWVIEQAVTTMKRWVDQGFSGRMAINISARQLADPSLVGHIRGVLGSHDLAPGYLELEITETALMEDVTAALEVLEGFRSLGVLLAVDDFGTGYSSLAYLKALPVTRIKIDRAFVTGLPDNEQDEVLCRTMISMAHSLGCEVIAEGVETEAQASWLATSGCDELQGFLLGRPEPDGYRLPQSIAR